MSANYHQLADPFPHFLKHTKHVSECAKGSNMLQNVALKRA
jgi:hypothetical protein